MWCPAVLNALDQLADRYRKNSVRAGGAPLTHWERYVIRLYHCFSNQMLPGDASGGVAGINPILFETFCRLSEIDHPDNDDDEDG